MDGNVRRFFERYLLPGFVYTGVVIGGGYATGRDLVQFFLLHNPAGAALGIGVAAAFWGVLLAVCFEFARIHHAYDYRTFFKHLLGPVWWLFEVPFLIMLVIGLAVMGAAAGEIVAGLTGTPKLVGTSGLLVAVGILVVTGTRVLERVLGWGSTLLYLFYIVFLWRCWQQYGAELFVFTQFTPVPAAAVSGFQYVVMNVSMIPGLLFCLRHFENRRQAVAAGVFAGILVVTPAVAFLLCMSAFYPAILEQPVPISYILGQLGADWFGVVFQLLLFFTLVQTGVGILHAVNERVDGTLRERGRALPDAARAGIAVGYVVVSIILAEQFGIIELIARGFTAMAWAFILSFAMPLMTVGVYKIARYRVPAAV
ncbi:MAG: hypothetical protein HYR49_02040 [Gammaproteobacteria bacterium]|nr:hypothetical protein [Gammaproteobacteria bacterium]